MTAKVRRLSASDIARELKGLEQRHGMASRDFLEQYEHGKLTHHRDYVRWVGLCRMAAAAKSTQHTKA